MAITVTFLDKRRLQHKNMTTGKLCRITKKHNVLYVKFVEHFKYDLVVFIDFGSKKTGMAGCFLFHFIIEGSAVAQSCNNHRLMQILRSSAFKVNWLTTGCN